MVFVWKALFCILILSISISTIHTSYGYAHNSPNEQIAKNVSVESVVCPDDFVLIKKKLENSVACVKPISVHKLVLRGWILISQSIITFTEGTGTSSLVIQKIFNDSITGRGYPTQPIPLENATDTGTSITMHFGDKWGSACMEKILILILIENNTATFLKDGTSAYCPVCLSGNTIIGTPNGSTNVKELKNGMSVWTIDQFGHKQSAIIVKTSKILVPTNHMMVHIMLSDGRELFASPRHPTADGRLLGDLMKGNILDNSYVKNTELVPYNENYTYDILPSGSTGFYWANGILVGSTLK